MEPTNNFNNFDKTPSGPSNTRAKALTISIGVAVLFVGVGLFSVGRQVSKQVDTFSSQSAELQKLIAEDATDNAVQTASPFAINNPIKNVDTDPLSGVKSTLNPF